MYQRPGRLCTVRYPPSCPLPLTLDRAANRYFVNRFVPRAYIRSLPNIKPPTVRIRRVSALARAFVTAENRVGGLLIVNTLLEQNGKKQKNGLIRSKYFLYHAPFCS